MATVYSDVITTSDLPDSLRVIYSTELEFTARPVLVTDQPQFVEVWPEFGAKRGSTVTRTVYHQLPASIAPLVENQDVTGGSVQDHQVSLQIREYGNAIGTSEQLDLLSYHGPISSIVKTLLGPNLSLTLDTLARNALWTAPNLSGGVKFKTYANGAAADRYHLATTNVFTADMARAVALRLGVRQVPVIGGSEPSFVCMTHPSVIYDLRGDTNWKDANLYAGAVRIFNGEEGMIHGIRFLKSTRHRVANGGALYYQTTLAAGTYNAGTNQVTVTSAASMAVGDEITLHVTGTSVTAPPAAGGGPVSWTAPNGLDPVEEQLVISAINGTTITFATDLLFTHSGGEFFTNAIDIYPMSFIGGVQPLAKGLALNPEVRVSLPTDKLRRMSYIGWYGLLGYGVARDWAYEICEVAATQNVAPVYGI